MRVTPNDSYEVSGKDVNLQAIIMPKYYSTSALEQKQFNLWKLQ
jgi:hypothetical protein